MRTLVLTLAVLGGCSLTPDAPAAPEGLADRSVVKRLAALEAQAASLQAQLTEAQATITTLRAEQEAVGGRLGTLDEQVGTLAHTIGDSYAGGHTIRSRVDAMYGAMYAEDADGVPQFQLVSLDAFEAALGGPGRQGGHLTVMTDYQVALASLGGGAPLPEGATPEELRAALFETDPATGVEVPRVDGLGGALAARLRQRPETLFQAWETTISDYMVELVENPLVGDSAGVEMNPLFDLSQRVRGAQDGVAKLDGRVGALETAVYREQPWLKSMDAKLPEWQALVLAAADAADAALWKEMLAGDDALQRQLDGLSAEVCRVGDLSEALAVDDWVMVDQCLESSNDQLCGTTGHL